MMKKTSLLCLGAMILLFSSCNNDEVLHQQGDSRIAFSALPTNAVRSTLYTATNLPDKFKVYALNGSDFIIKGDVATKSDSEWVTPKEYHWPTGDPELSFYGVAPESQDLNVASGVVTINSFSPETKAKEQKDLIIATNKGNSKTSTFGTAVPMHFQHALSAIEIKATNSNTNYTIKVLGVKLVNMTQAAKLSIVAPASETQTPAILQTAWTGGTTNATYYADAASESAVVTLDGSAKDLHFGNGAFLVVPTNSAKWNGNTEREGRYIAVLCQITSGDTQIYPAGAAAKGKYAYAAVAVDTSWDPGKKYIYTLNFLASGSNSGGAGKIAPDLNGDSSSAINGQVATNGTGFAGDNILGGVIKFTVTVENFTDTLVGLDM